MKWRIRGFDVSHSDSKYLIDWSRKAASKGAQEVQDFLLLHCGNDIIYSEYRLPRGLLRIDYLNLTKRFAIEYDDCDKTGHHVKYNPFFHKNRIGYLNSIKRDSRKQEILEQNSIKLVQIFKKDLPLTREFFHQFDIWI